MRCINKKPKDKKGEKFLGILFLVMALCTLTGCGSLSYDMGYTVDSGVSSYNVVSRQETRTAAPFASSLCVVTGNVAENSVDMSQTGAAALFSLSDNGVIYARNAHTKLNPASLTKVMTALVALENGRLDQQLKATNTVNITESGAVLCGLKSGDTMTLDQALRIMLLYSANDAAMMVAENVGGTVEHFVEMMNEKARELGATNTSFMNPHGLTEANHYTTAYDLYLIFNEAIKNETFNEIIHMNSYQTVYYDGNGNEKDFNKNTTNKFLLGEYKAPANVTVIGGKTGTTQAAGHCLMLLARDENGAPYISIILGAEDNTAVYQKMQDLLDEIHK